MATILTTVACWGRVVENSQLEGRIVLVVEDEPLVGLEIVETLAASGAHVVSAGRIPMRSKPLIVIKSRRRYSTSNLAEMIARFLLRQHLSQRQIPFFFYTGYSAAPNGWDDAPMISKPAQGAQIVDAVERLCSLHRQTA